MIQEDGEPIQDGSQSAFEEIGKGLVSLKDFPGIGGVLNFNQERRIMRPLAFKIIKDGKFQLLE